MVSRDGLVYSKTQRKLMNKCFDGADLTDRFIASIELTYSEEKGRAKKVHQYERTGRLITTHSSLAHAGKSIEGAGDWGIRRCCQGKTLLYKGFIWRYA